MVYNVKELFYSFQGEGIRAGRAAVFCRFSGCNLWSGREEDRATARCQFCDTDFVGTDGPGGGRYDTEGLVAAILAAFGDQQPEELYDDPVWRSMASANSGMVWNGMGMSVAPPMPYVVFTGGEPALHLTPELISALRGYRLELAVESNGTLALPNGIDWVCISPKAGTELVVKTGQELKLVWPQEGIQPENFAVLPFENFVLQAVDTGDPARNAQAVRDVLAYCREHPSWRFGPQLHKLVGFA